MEEELILDESENIKTSDYIFQNKEIRESFAVEDLLSEEAIKKLKEALNV